MQCVVNCKTLQNTKIKTSKELDVLLFVTFLSLKCKTSKDLEESSSKNDSLSTKNRGWLIKETKKKCQDKIRKNVEGNYKNNLPYAMVGFVHK